MDILLGSRAGFRSPSPNQMLAKIFLLSLTVGMCFASDSRLEIRRLLEAGRELEARQLLLTELRKNPNDEEANLLLGQIAFSRKEFSEAVTRYRKAPTLLARDPLLRINLAEALLETKHSALLADVVKSIPHTDAVAQFELGVLLARFDKYKAAEPHLQVARRRYPDKFAAGYNLAVVQFKMAKYRDCAVTLEELVQAGFGNPDLLNLLGQAYAESDQIQKALETLQAAVRQSPRDERNYVALSKLCVDHERAEMALPVLDQGLGYLPNSYSLLVQRAYIHLTQSRFSDAESDYRRALATQPDQDAAGIGLGLVFIQTERHPEAVTILQEVIQKHPTFLAYYLLGDAWIRQGVDQKAQEPLEVAASMEPTFAPAHTSLGKLYLRRDEPEAAIKHLEAAVNLDPEDMSAYYQLSIAYRKKGQIEMAQKALARFQTLSQDERNLGIGKFLTKRLRQAGIASPSIEKERRAP